MVSAQRMPEERPEAAAHIHARALVDSDIRTAFMGMTADGLASAMEVGNTTWNILSYELGEGSFTGDDYVVEITFRTDLGFDKLRYRFREEDGAWKVVHIEVAT